MMKNHKLFGAIVGYVICDSDNVKEFPSRKKAIREDALMYRVYVDS